MDPTDASAIQRQLKACLFIVSLFFKEKPFVFKCVYKSGEKEDLYIVFFGEVYSIGVIPIITLMNIFSYFLYISNII